MTFLPIVERELRTAARRTSTFRIRWWAALIAMGISFISLVFLSLSGGRTSGNLVFSMLSGYTFGVCLLTGVVLTSDALSEEKRAGTLGLLFLTHLRGYDVVLGKLAARSLNALYALLALLPINALAMVLGGVTGAEFWRMSLAQANGLFFSLAAGICVSAILTDAYRAMGGTLAFLLLMAVGLPALAAVVIRLGLSPAWTRWAWVSPSFPFSCANEANYLRQAGGFWTALACSHLLGWILLALASLLLPRCWRPGINPGPAQGAWWRAAHWRKKTWSRLESISKNPVFWLRYGEFGIQWGAWAVVTAWASLVLVGILWSPNGQANAILGGYSAAPFGFLLKVLFAFQSGRFFAEGRQNGTLELLLCTPLTDREIVSGQNLALWRSFRAPLLVFVLLLFAPAFLAIGRSAFAGDPTPLANALPGTMLSGIYSLRLAADLAAVCWVGMGLALTSKTPRLAPAYTILFVLILPSALCWLDALADLAFIAWGTAKCRQNLRRLLAGQYQSPR